MACLPHTATDVGLCPSPSLIHAYHRGPSCASPTVRTSLNGLQICHDPESWYLLFLLSGTLLNIPGMTAGTYRPPSGRNNKMRWQRLARGGTLCLSLVPPYLKRLGQVDDIDARIWYPPGRHHRGLCESKLVGCSSHPPGNQPRSQNRGTCWWFVSQRVNQGEGIFCHTEFSSVLWGCWILL